MSDISEQILDYASPMARSPLRLAVKSIIRIKAEGDSVAIIEMLTGQGQALAAIIFTGLTVSLLGFGLVGDVAPKTLVDIFNPVLVIYFVVVCGTGALMLAVIHNNWRQTVLRVSRERVTLTLSSPFKMTTHEWPSADVRHVHVMQTLDKRTQRVIYDLQIEMGSGSMVQLFGGHDTPELSEIADAVRGRLPAGSGEELGGASG